MASNPSFPPFDVATVRAHFPALMQTVNGVTPAYLDNPGGTQVPEGVLAAIRRYLIEANSNRHGMFHTSELTDATVDAAREAMADLLNATPGEIVFGPNMTTLTFSISRAIGRTLQAGDEIVLTHMDHDGNVSPWLLLARDYDLTVRWADFDPETGEMDLASFQNALSDRTKVAAFVYASNALGTINDAAKLVEMAHSAGALAYVDAVQYAPHGPIDVAALDCDFLVCSAYKFFGPHAGIAYGRQELLDTLPAYKVRPAPSAAPDRWETGTANHEGLAGVTAAVEYLAWIGETFGADDDAQAAAYSGRRATLKKGIHAIQNYEHTVTRHLLEGLNGIEGVTVRGIDDPERAADRVPTVIFNVEGRHPEAVARRLGEQGIYVWDGNYYALEVMERLGMEQSGGMVRVGAVHYNTHAEIDRFLAAVEDIARG